MVSLEATTKGSITAKDKVIFALLAPLILASAYFISVFWRVSFAEYELFGRSTLIPLSLSERRFTDPPKPGSFGTGTYEFVRDGRHIAVYKQLINGFQHAYGSALVAFELGPELSDYIFCANEYLEAYTEKDGRTERHFLDTKKDLHNNAVGRNIGVSARSKSLVGRDAQKYIIAEVLAAIDSGTVINHYQDPRVESLPTLEQYGCPGLPPRPAKSSSVSN